MSFLIPTLFGGLFFKMMCRVSVAKQITQHIALGMDRKYQKIALFAI